MTHNLHNKRILVLGGTGLVGRNTVMALLKRGVRQIGVVGLENDGGWKMLEEIENSKKIKVKKYKSDLLLPSQFRRYSFEKITEQKNIKKLVSTLASSMKKNEIRKESLYKIILDFHPDYIVDSVNTATQCAYINTHSSVIDSVGIGTLLLLRYYQLLYHLLRWDFWKEEKKQIRILEYIKIGTTGIGGMGLDIPFTHGEEQPSLLLLKKVAMAGSQTNILFAMRNSRGVANIQEIIPATSIFQLSGFNTLNKEIDGGESRGYALEEFRLLTDQRLMGVIDARELAEIIVEALHAGKSRYNALEALVQSKVSGSSHSSIMRRRTLECWLQNHNEQATVSVAHGNLGPWRTKKLLFELYIILDYYRAHPSDFWRLTPQKIQKYITSTLSKNTPLRKEIKRADLRVSTSILPSHTASDKHIDLSIKNITKWRKTLQSLGIQKNRKSLYAGDILTQLIEQRHNLNTIP